MHIKAGCRRLWCITSSEALWPHNSALCDDDPPYLFTWDTEEKVLTLWRRRATAFRGRIVYSMKSHNTNSISKRLRFSVKKAVAWRPRPRLLWNHMRLHKPKSQSCWGWEPGTVSWSDIAWAKGPAPRNQVPNGHPGQSLTFALFFSVVCVIILGVGLVVLLVVFRRRLSDRDQIGVGIPNFAELRDGEQFTVNFHARDTEWSQSSESIACITFR